MKEKEINSYLIRWYKKNKRQLPWRKLESNNLPNPYHTLVSEYMLQQTTVPTVTKRFEKFISNWPSIEALSKTSEKQMASKLDVSSEILKKENLFPNFDIRSL